MASGSISAPGTEYGPCAGTCTHTDCAESRRQAETPCAICGESIGYDRQFYQRDNWTVLTHAACTAERPKRYKLPRKT
ncbi:hypothetical protein ES703_122005 [subsurface metagenome]